MKKFLVAAGLMAGLILGVAPAASATGDDAVVTVEVLENGDVEVTSTKDLSNVHVAVCVELEVVVVKFDDLDDKVEVFTVEGDLIAVLAHSGNNTTAEAEALLELLGGDVNGNSIGVIAFFDEEALEDCQPTEEPPTTTTTTTIHPTTTTTVPETTTTTQPPVTVTTSPQLPTTLVPPVVGTQCVDTNGFPFVTSESVCPSSLPVAEPISTPIGELPRTGAGSVLMWLGLILVISGAAALSLGKFIKIGGGE